MTRYLSFTILFCQIPHSWGRPHYPAGHGPIYPILPYVRTCIAILFNLKNVGVLPLESHQKNTSVPLRSLAHCQAWYLTNRVFYWRSSGIPSRQSTVSMEYGIEYGCSGVSAASGLLGIPGTYQKSPGSWDLRYPLGPYQKLKSLRIWPTIFWEWSNFVYKKISNIEREKANVRSEPDFYWGESPVNFKGQNPGGESFSIFPSGVQLSSVQFSVLLDHSTEWLIVCPVTVHTRWWIRPCMAAGEHLF